MTYLQDFIARFTTKNIEGWFADSEIVGIDNTVYAVPKNLKKLSDDINKKPQHVGLRLGSYYKRIFRPSNALLQELSKHTAKKIVINSRAAWLFICGRDIFAENVIDTPTLKQQEQVLILNMNKEVLGYGLVKNIRDGKPSVKNLYDIGKVLRQ